MNRNKFQNKYIVHMLLIAVLMFVLVFVHSQPYFVTAAIKVIEPLILLVCFCSVVQRTLIDVNLVVRHPFGIDILEIDSMRVQTVGGLGYVVDALL